jgi:Uncharacterized protein conserved in bacteria
MEITPPVEVPAEQLPPEVVVSLIESFIMREGTDYGVNEVSIEKKIEQVQKQLTRKDVVIVFDFQTETATLLTKIEWKKLSANFV